jgi:glycosyltransferase involved in cell wall biosynthesis
MQNKKTAIICDWLIDFWWAELVISHLLEMYPEADIYTSVCYMDHPMLEGRRVYTSWIQKIPFFNRKHKLAGILRPWAFRSFDLSGYDVVICSSSAESKQVAMGKWNRFRHVDARRHPAQTNTEQDFSQVRNDRNQKAESRKQNGNIIKNDSTLPTANCQLPTIFCYCHTPTRYYWSHAKEYEDMMEFGFLNPLVKWVFRLVKWWMQNVDYEAAQRVDYFIANSKTTAERIKKYYNRESEVIYPGVESSLQKAESRKQNETIKNNSALPTANCQLPTPYYLGMSRCIPYKRLDLLVDAFNQNGKKLILCTNTDNLLYRELKERSKDNITWIFTPSLEEKTKLYREAKAFLFPPEEDFGLVPVEAMMCGTPVIAYGVWWATESVVDGETGIFFSPQTPEALNEAIEKFETMDWDKERIRARGMEFSKEKFQNTINNFIQQHV